MAGTDEKWTIEKLDSKNWITWKFQMKHLLLAKGLWSFVDGTEVLADGADAAARTDFQQKTQKAFSTIVMAVSVPQLYLITSTESPSDVDSTQKSIRERNFSQQADVEETVLQNGNDREHYCWVTP